MVTHPVPFNDTIKFKFVKQFNFYVYGVFLSIVSAYSLDYNVTLLYFMILYRLQCSRLQISSIQQRITCF